MMVTGMPGVPASAAPSSEPWPVTLRAQMARLTTIGFRLNHAAVEQCPRTSAAIGLTLDHIGAYPQGDRPAVAQLLGMDDAPQVAGVATGGPADVAGVKVGDDLISIDGRKVSDIVAAMPKGALVSDELEQRLAQLPATAPIRLGLRRGGDDIAVAVQPLQACAARYVIKTDGGIDAFSDAENVAISSKLIAFTANDDELALIAGHELGHIAHQDGDAGSITQRRAMEDRADITGLHFAACAGFDPEAGLQFWLRRERQDMLRWFRDPTHRSRTERVKLMREEIPKVHCPFSQPASG
ncbi:M48 family metalloprotease [Novosphingobium guangzhouense]|nr:M48 family metalloprotease [Novosphingobium guangzhouense]